MKKALVLGALAFFAINIATVQNTFAQNKETKKDAYQTKIEKEKAAIQSETFKKADNSKATKKVSNAETAKTTKATPKMDKKNTSAAKAAVKGGSSKEAKLSTKPSAAKGAPAAMKPKKPTDPGQGTESANKKTEK